MFTEITENKMALVCTHADYFYACTLYECIIGLFGCCQDDKKLSKLKQHLEQHRLRLSISANDLIGKSVSIVRNCC